MPHHTLNLPPPARMCDAHGSEAKKALRLVLRAVHKLINAPLGKPRVDVEAERRRGAVALAVEFGRVRFHGVP